MHLYNKKGWDDLCIGSVRYGMYPWNSILCFWSVVSGMRFRARKGGKYRHAKRALEETQSCNMHNQSIPTNTICVMWCLQYVYIYNYINIHIKHTYSCIYIYIISYNVGKTMINHPFGMVYTNCWWWFGSWPHRPSLESAPKGWCHGERHVKNNRWRNDSPKKWESIWWILMVGST